MASLAPMGSARKDRVFVYRHSVMVRVLHWINAIVLLVMLMSGLQIFNAHPALYWGKTSAFDHPALSMTAWREPDGSLKGVTQVGPFEFNTTGILGVSSFYGQMVVRGFPSWATIPGFKSLALGRLWHFFFAWLFVINGLLFASYAISSGHVRELLPTGHDIRNIGKDFIDHLRLRFPKGKEALHYNVLQKLAYFTVIFILGPLIVLTGLTMSPTIDTAVPQLLFLFGGRQTARTIHFICAFSFLGFFVIHIVMLVLSAPINGLRSMITGRFAIESDDD
ncbi:MAG TPA: cytochrome b/b6 domain-containing protein [Rhizomicrobium sp.]|nr:cytochrome b/b6 domain-containing protein [Rhizomicrobium sp.]